MASENLVNQLGAKIDAQNTKLDTLRDVLDARYKILIWAIGLAGLVLSAAILFG